MLGNLPQFTADATDILKVLDVEHGAVVSLVQNGGTTFAALSQDQSALRNLITSAETTFATTAANNDALAETFQVFPTFLNETKATMTRLKSFALDTDPLIKELEPVAQKLGPTLRSVRILSPDLRRFFVTLGPLITASKTGLPGVSQTSQGRNAAARLARSVPRAAQPDPQLAVAAPAADLRLHLQRRHGHLGQDDGARRRGADLQRQRRAATTCASSSRSAPRRCRCSRTATPNNRGNTYPNPLWLANPENLQKGNFPSWDCKNTGAGGDGSVAADTTPGTGHMACWVAPTLPGAAGQFQIPHIQKATYSRR